MIHRDDGACQGFHCSLVVILQFAKLAEENVVNRLFTRDSAIDISILKLSVDLGETNACNNKLQLQLNTTLAITKIIVIISNLMVM